MSANYLVVEIEGGLLQDVRPFSFSLDALEFARAQWERSTDTSAMHQYWSISPDAMDEPGYDPEWGGVQRGWRMHWFNDDMDIYVVDLEASYRQELAKHLAIAGYGLGTVAVKCNACYRTLNYHPTEAYLSGLEDMDDEDRWERVCDWAIEQALEDHNCKAISRSGFLTGQGTHLEPDGTRIEDE